jgi:AsmA protein
MGRLVKFVAYFVGALVALLIITIIAVAILFDPNDYREDIETVVEKNTGRQLSIEGDLSLSVFPWLAVEMGKAQLGNAAGFGEQPMVGFETARLSVRLLPALLRQEFQVATASLDGLQLNLAINEQGRSNWQDFLDAMDAKAQMQPQVPEEDGPGQQDMTAALDIAGIKINDSLIRYADAQAGTNVQLNDLNVAMGAISSGAGTILIDGFSIDALLEGVAAVPTTFGLETNSVSIDTRAETITLDPVELGILGLDISALVEPIKFSGEITPVAKIEIDAFSLRNLMERLDVEPPVTADPAALGKVTMAATASVGTTAISLTDLVLILDDTTFEGSLAIPQGTNDVFLLELNGDDINLDRYMAPVAEDVSDETAVEEVPIEIPVDLLRLMNARGSLNLAGASLSGMQFEDIEVVVVLDDGKLRLHPFAATLFEGKYNGDIRIDASGNTPTLAVNENIVGVQLGALTKAMFDQDNITGAINGSFKLSGRGADLAAVQRTLGGNISMELVDGTFEGTDIWYELRKARALIRQEEPPEPELPARTRFSDVNLSGPVSDGVFNNDTLNAALPFMRLTGSGKVDFAAATVDYNVTAQVFDKPELVGDDATAEELKDLSKVRIPIRITGPITAPSVRPDTQKVVEDAVRKEVEDVLKDKLKDLLDR